MKKTVAQSVKIGKITAVFVVFLISFLLFPLFSSTNLKSLYAANSTDPPNFTYTLTGDNATNVKYTGSATTIIIPDKLDGHSVTSIGSFAIPEAIRSTVTSITIPSNVTSIVGQAFQNCTALTSIAIPSGVTSIELKVFMNCTSLTSITIPSGVTSIGASAFSGCTSLTSITVTSKVTSISNNSFSGCTNLAEVNFKRESAPTFGANSFLNIKSGAIANVPAGSTGYINTIYPFIGGNPLKLEIADSPSSGGPSALTPDEWVDLNLDIDQLVNHYGATSTGFLEMLYDNSMQRIPDTSGLNYWNEQLANNVFGAKVAAMTGEEYVNFLYSTLFARVPDTDGYNNWLGYINSGYSKEETLRAFLNNEEWINICKLFNVTP